MLSDRIDAMNCVLQCNAYVVKTSVRYWNGIGLAYIEG
jgi:hypothetical protein